jgi:hypothetical protein
MVFSVGRWCFQVEGGVFKWEIVFSSGRYVLRWKILHGFRWRFHYGSVYELDGVKDDTKISGICNLGTGEYVNDIIFDTKLAFGVVAPGAVTLITNKKTCGPFGPRHGGGDKKYSGKQLLFIKGYLGLVNDWVEFTFTSC